MQDILEEVAQANTTVPSHARISPELVLLLPPNATFPKSSKGSLQRGRAYQAYAKHIEEIYARFEESGNAEPAPNGDRTLRTRAEITDFITKTVQRMLGSSSILPGSDLFNEGLNSLQAVRLRNMLQKVVISCGDYVR